MITETGAGIQEDCGNLFCGGERRGGAGSGGERMQAGGQRFKHARAQRQKVELAFAAHFDQARSLQLLDVVREGCRRNLQGRAGLHAAERAGGFCHPLQQFKTLRIGKSFEERGAPRARQPRSLQRRCSILRIDHQAILSLLRDGLPRGSMSALGDSLPFGDIARGDRRRVATYEELSPLATEFDIMVAPIEREIEER